MAFCASCGAKVDKVFLEQVRLGDSETGESGGVYGTPDVGIVENPNERRDVKKPPLGGVVGWGGGLPPHPAHSSSETSSSPIREHDTVNMHLACRLQVLRIRGVVHR